MKARIYKPAKTAMQSGKGNTKKWLLVFEPEDTRFINSVMGWTGNTDMNQEIKLKFDTKDEAIGYAERKKLDYKVIEPHRPKTKIQAYADNFI